ncbi:hydroxyacylglutathione hydrolase [Pseudoprimorskyibacter insulae]|uniref:Hydroxyacylglutathione hydrolase n=1 Tax=Pseudoprimorskyibacter insulae TaxID=1695997 RepID=A0A2R8AND7_9RHOB|nr:hydroxyacylglutathione hydrolase [Pseudoprimorskyibacter insulae]SPF77545.1 Hydroxyacylglutathione hydrolase GloB [Pseudoprimorskyibacter insulae]
MALELVTIPALKDNYTYLLHDAETGATAVIDVPEAGPIDAELTRRGWTLTEIWLTHHHWDHIDGVPDLIAKHPAKITGASADAHRLPKLDRAVADGDTFNFGGEEIQIFDVSGHTVGHIALYAPASGILFTADSLMALGCGRLFEGTPDQMWTSLSKLAALPPQTIVCSGHEYTQSNAKFALTIEPDNAALISRSEAIDTARAAGQPTVPSTLSEELDTNPFLRAGNPSVQKHMGMLGQSPASVFAEIRHRKDNF